MPQYQCLNNWDLKRVNSKSDDFSNVDVAG